VKEGEKGGERERRLSSPNWFVTEMNTDGTIPIQNGRQDETCPYPCSNKSPSDAHIRMESERAFIITTFP
jgi:hypothetical protein